MQGRRLTDPVVLDRIAALVIPPAWSDVWICPLANGHIQATGFDARGRRQYRYHDWWRVQRDREKFDHMLEFARRLPSLRLVLADHLVTDGLSRERVLAAAVRLLDLGFFRIGTEGYAEENQTYGLATMLKRHVRLADGGLNVYLREVMDIDCSAKDFRTWNATVLAEVALAVGALAASPTARKRCVNRAMTEVAYYLGNTPAVCRKSYVDPRVVDCYLAGETIAARLDELGAGAAYGNLSTQGAIEEAVLDLLEPGGARVAA